MSRIETREFYLKNGRKYIIRKARLSDAKSLLDFFNAIILKDDYNVTIPADIKKQKMTIKKEQEYIKSKNKNGNILILAEINKRIIGSVSLEAIHRQRLSHVASLQISVHKRFRRNGIATALVTIVIQQAQKESLFEKIGLGVLANNIGAIRLYKKLGFVEEGRKIREIKIGPGSYVDSILMYKFIE